MADHTDPTGAAQRLFGKVERELRALRTDFDAFKQEQRRVNQAVQKGAVPSAEADRAAVRRGKPSGRAVLDEAAGQQRGTKTADAHTKALQRMEEQSARVRRIQQSSTSALRGEVAQRGLASQALQKHGALTTEFISAAARGNTTLAEMRYQVGSTIGKFAGWTAAAGAVFLAVDALKELGTGAIEGGSQINQLQRVVNGVNTDRAHKQLRSLARDMNVSLEDAGGAFYEAGKQSDIAPNQDAAAQLARTTLKATKIADLDTVDSVRFLTAILRGFKLEAKDSVKVLDQLNQVQNEFGVNIRDTASGTAKAAATFTAANNGKADPASLIALVATISRGGYTGDEAGTAIRRSAQKLKQPGTKNRAQLAGFGIDARDPIVSVYQQAMDAVKSGRVKGPKINELATALSTPQLSSRFAQLLQNPKLYDDIKARGTAGPKTRGSADRELAKTLRSSREQIKGIGVDLQTLGDSLAQGGFFDALGGMVRLLRVGLHLTQSISDLFNEFPKPLRHSLSVFVQLYGLLRLIRRFNPGELGQARTGVGGFFRQTEHKQIGGFLRQGASEQVKFFKDQQEGLAHRSAVAHLTSQTASNEAVRVQREYGAAAQNKDTAALKKINDANAASIRAHNEAALAKRNLLGAQENYTSAVKHQTALDRDLRRNPKLAPSIAQGYGVIPQTADRPTYIPPARVDELREQVKRSGQTLVPGTGGYGSSATRGVNLLREDASRTSKAMLAARARISGTPAALRAAASSARLMGAELLATLGPLGLIIANVVVIGEIVKTFKRSSQQLHKHAASDVKGAEKTLADTRNKSFLQKVQNKYADFAQRQLFGTPFAGLVGPTDNQIAEEQAKNDLKFQRDEKKRRDEAAEKERRRNAKLHRSGQPFAGQNVSRINSRLERINTFTDLYGSVGTDDLELLGRGYATVAERIGGDRTPKKLEKLAKAKAAVDAAAKSLQSRLQEDLQLATGPGDRSAAYGNFNQGLRALQTGFAGQIARNRARTRTQEREARRLRARISSREGVTVSEKAGEAQGERNKDLADDRLRLALLRDNIKKNKGNLKLLTRQQRELARQIRLLRFQANLDRFDQDAEVLKQRTEVRTSGTRNQGVQIGLRLRAANVQLQRALRSSFRNTREGEKRIRDAIIERNNILHEQEDLAVERLQAFGELRAAGQSSERGRIAAQLSTARQVLALFRSQGRDPAETARQAAEVINLQRQLAEQVLEDAKALADARFDDALSRTADPNREAAIEVNRARSQLNFARQIKDPVQRRIETTKAGANLREARGRRTLTRFNEKVDAFDYKATIGDYSPEQQIEGLQRIMRSIPDNLLKTVDGLRDFKRDLAKRIHALKKEADDTSGFELNVGNIRLPTIYEVRRAIKGGYRNGPVISQATNVNVTVNRGGDEAAVYGAIDSAGGTQVRSAARAAGLL